MLSSLQLVVNDSVYGLDSFVNILKKIRNVVSYLNQSYKAMRDYMNICIEENVKVKMLVSDVSTRWNSSYKMDHSQQPNYKR